MISSILEPASRFSKTVATGIRVSRNTHAPLRLSGTLSTAGHCDQSRGAMFFPPLILTFYHGLTTASFKDRHLRILPPPIKRSPPFLPLADPSRPPLGPNRRGGRWCAADFGSVSGDGRSFRCCTVGELLQDCDLGSVRAITGVCDENQSDLERLALDEFLRRNPIQRSRRATCPISPRSASRAA